MKTQQIWESFFRMRTLTLSFFLLTLLAQGGEAAYGNHPACGLKKVFFQQRYIAHQIMLLAQMASWEDHDSSTRLLDTPMFDQFHNEEDRCYLLKEMMGLFLKEIEHSYLPKFERYMRDVFPYFLALKNWLDDCSLIGDGTLLHREIENTKNKLNELGEKRQIKTLSELDLLYAYTKKYCAY